MIGNTDQNAAVLLKQNVKKMQDVRVATSQELEQRKDAQL